MYRIIVLLCAICTSLGVIAQPPDVSPETPAIPVADPTATPAPAPEVPAPAPEVPVPAPETPAPAPAEVPMTEVPAPAPAPEAGTPEPAPVVESAALTVPKVVQLAPGPEAQQQIQEAFIVAEPGTILEFAEGRYLLTMGLSLDVDGCTIRGAGMDKTILDFSQQDAGSEGLLVTADNVLLHDFAIENAKGNCFKSNAANNLTLRRLRAEWTGGPKETNGAYGLYPVSGNGLLLEECIVKGASDAGIYVGQTEQIIVRKNRVEYNVAGIEIENCYSADVYENVATLNTGGILVFDLPGLPKQRGHDVRVFKNEVFNNSTKNFAPAGNIVGKVPTGTGVMVMSNANVHIFENNIRDHGTVNVLVCSYLLSGNEIVDPNYYPFPEGISIHNNVFGKVGNSPDGDFGTMAVGMLGLPLPDIIWDGVMNPAKAENGQMPEALRIYVDNNTKEGGGEIAFANVDALRAITDPATAVVNRDVSVHAGTIPEPAPILLPGAR